MLIILKIAFRNLIRKKMRNGILGLAIVVGITSLILINGFSKGISYLIINNFIGSMMGHVEISVLEKTKGKRDILRDQIWFEERIQNTFAKNESKQINQNLKSIEENLVNWVQVIGNGKSDTFVLSAQSKETLKNNLEKNELNPSLQVKEGSLQNFISDDNTAMLYANKAKNLNIKVGDTINMRLTTITGQREVAKYRIVALLKAASYFQDMTIYIGNKDFKKTVGLKSHETIKLKIALHQPLEAKNIAHLLREAFHPELAILPLTYRGSSLISLTPNEKKNCLSTRP